MDRAISRDLTATHGQLTILRMINSDTYCSCNLGIVSDDDLCAAIIDLSVGSPVTLNGSKSSCAGHGTTTQIQFSAVADYDNTIRHGTTGYLEDSRARRFPGGGGIIIAFNLTET